MPAELYLWIKALHVIAVIAWMAGLLYLPRLFVYHSTAKIGSQQSETFKVMERRLMNIIMIPAMILSVVLGSSLFLWEGTINFETEMWIYVKIILALFLISMNFLFYYWVYMFANDKNKHSAKLFRIVNEIPTVLMIAIVILVIVRPF